MRDCERPQSATDLVPVRERAMPGVCVTKAMAMWRRATVLLLAIALFGPAPARAAELFHRRAANLDLIGLEGDVEPGDAGRFQKLAAQYPKAVVVLNSAGGVLFEALDIGKIIHLKHYDTLVAHDMLCASACALIWVAGERRMLSPRGKVGFHAGYRDNDGQAEEVGVANALIGRYLTMLNLSERAVIFATSAAPDEMLWLDQRSRGEAGISFVDFDDSTMEVGGTTATVAAPVSRGTPGSHDIDNGGGSFTAPASVRTLTRPPAPRPAPSSPPSAFTPASRPAGPAAGQWHLSSIRREDGDIASVTYVEASTVVREGDDVIFWSDTHIRPKAGQVTDRFIVQHRANCTSHEHRAISVQYWLGGQAIFDRAARAPDVPAPNSALAQNIAGACSGTFLTGIVDDRDAAAARLFAR